MKPLVVCVAVIAAHFAYYLFPPGVDRNWAQYVGTGIGFSLLCWVIASNAGGGVVGVLTFLAAVWGAIEGAQNAVCGAFHWGRVANEDLCISLVGPWPYVFAATVFSAVIITKKGRHG